MSWSHVMLRDGFHKLSSGFTYFPAKDPNKGVDKTTGLFIHRAAPGEGKSVVSLELQWKFSANGLTKHGFIEWSFYRGDGHRNGVYS